MGVVRETFHRVRKEYPDSLITKEMEPWQFKQRSSKYICLIFLIGFCYNFLTTGGTKITDGSVYVTYRPLLIAYIETLTFISNTVVLYIHIFALKYGGFESRRGRRSVA